MFWQEWIAQGTAQMVLLSHCYMQNESRTVINALNGQGSTQVSCSRKEGFNSSSQFENRSLSYDISEVKDYRNDPWKNDLNELQAWRKHLCSKNKILGKGMSFLGAYTGVNTPIWGSLISGTFEGQPLARPFGSQLFSHLTAWKEIATKTTKC